MGEGPAGVTGLTSGLLIAPTAGFKLRLEPQIHLSSAVGAALLFLIAFPKLILEFLHHSILAPRASVSPADPILPESLPCLGAVVRINN